jgi:Arc/MetJ-type ribon-helix-helix transcriptional regulator
MAKKPISATIEEDLIKWLNKEVDGRKYRNKSHLIEIALENLRKQEKD